ncbi:MAG: hypothetical protein ACLP66_10070, partial [Polyangia bacterium]
LDNGEWVRKLTNTGWLTKNGTRHYPRKDRERHPTTKVVTPQELDEAAKSGVPFKAEDTPTTGMHNPTRRT